MKFKIKNTNDVIEFSCRSLSIRLVAWFYDLVPVPMFYSRVFKFHFNTMSEYWFEVGKRNALVEVLANQKDGDVRGLSMNEVLQKAASVEFGSGPGVILYNIDVENIGRTLDRIEGVKASVLSQDTVFIHAKSREHARKMVSKLPLSMADVIAVERGFIFSSNRD